MMFANAKNIQPDLVGKFDFFQKILHPLNRAEPESGCMIRDDRPKAVDTDLHVRDSVVPGLISTLTGTPSGE